MASDTIILELTVEELIILFRDYKNGPCDELRPSLYPTDKVRETILYKLNELTHSKHIEDYESKTIPGTN